MLDVRLYLLQRLSALVMIPLACGHLAVMIYAVQGGLSAAEILGRTSGSLFWGLFYGFFVLSVSIHAAIGVRVISYEWFGLPQRWLALLGWGIFIVLLGLGGRAVLAVTAA